MAASSKSSQKAKDVVLALLLLWSLVSLIIIVVWSTSPDWKGVAQCNKELQGTKEQLKMSTVTWNNNKVALEEKVEKTREEVEHKTAEIMLLQTHLNATNASLEECRQENVGLNKNISVLQENVEQLRQTEANLTAQLSQQEDHIDALQNNLTQAFHQTKACLKLQEAAKNQMFAAQSQTKACESQQQYVQKQLQKCKADSEASPTLSVSTPQHKTPAPATDDHSAASPLAGIPALLLLACSTLHLITCESPSQHTR